MNKLTATILSTISLSGAALIAAALLSTTSSHAAPAPKGDAVIGYVHVVETVEADDVTVLPEVVVTPRTAKRAPFEMVHVARVASSETVDRFHRVRALTNIAFDLEPQL
jgi:hypothetical protein